MDEFRCPQTRKQQSKHRKRLSQDQVRLLETNFNFNNKLDPDRKSRLALELGIPPRQVAIWYQNKRAREKNQSLEADHKTLQQQLENVVAENARLEGEVERLKAELNKIHDVLNAFNSSTCCEEVGSSSLSSEQNLEKELYAALIGVRDPFVAPDGYDFFG
ncbi:homeobox-leucine zipper protein ATHB-52-like [Sesamum indicum]|uniref:Homeobox-leucine zipper protein n=1 Tax=Sesamum indicum TaxID=4182 RepID=A0A6I9UEJ7_SESIN|nr:homeobox-leucine zipper protein ATHB-52-like [Sesamum indicum]